jgi:hypothetical protein
MPECAREIFGEMQRKYASGNFARHVELQQQLGKAAASLKFPTGTISRTPMLL